MSPIGSSKLPGTIRGAGARQRRLAPDEQAEQVDRDAARQPDDHRGRVVRRRCVHSPERAGQRGDRARTVGKDGTESGIEHQRIVMPPLTLNVCPVTSPASREVR